MWIFTKYGFYSVTEHPGDKRLMQVRARARVDLERLQGFAANKTKVSLGKISETDHTDYRYRIYCSKAVWYALADALARDINYSNFKNQIRDDFRHKLYFRVWSTMLDLQRHFMSPAEKGQPALFDRDYSVSVADPAFEIDTLAQDDGADPGDPFYDPGRSSELSDPDLQFDDEG